jgi:hypothetical protein
MHNVNRNSDKAHVVLTLNTDGGYMVSVGTPVNNSSCADGVCVRLLLAECLKLLPVLINQQKLKSVSLLIC